jgi:hypothetical protein
MINRSKLANVCPKGKHGPAPKWGRLGGHTASPCMVFTRHETRREVPSKGHTKMNTQDGVTCLWFSGELEQATSRKPWAGGMAQEAKALGNAKDTLN